MRTMREARETLARLAKRARTARATTRPLSPSNDADASASAIVQSGLAVLESSFPLITIDDAGYIVAFNPAAEKTFGYRSDQVIGRRAGDLLVPASLRDRHFRTLERLRQSGREALVGRTLQTTGMRSDGSEFPVEVSIGRVLVEGRPLFTACARDITARKQAEASRARLASFVHASGDAIIGHTADGIVTSWNRAAQQLYGYEEAEVLGRHIDTLLVEEQVPPASEAVWGAAPWSSHERQVTGVAKDGTRLQLAVTTSEGDDDPGRVAQAVTIARDVSERMAAEARRAELEQQLQQAQKMEAIGRLASGVAHDFNNLLSVIINYANFLAGEVGEGTAASEDVERIRQAARSAVGLIRQLLVFSRKEAIEPQIVDANQLVLGMEKLLRRTIGEDIRLETRLATDLWLTKIDPGQMEQVLMNLSVNARYAMPHGGTLSIDTSNVTADEYLARKHGIPPGDYIRIAVSDNGPGMSETVRAHIFEPFYTTKPEGEGTGLGLATVYAIVEGSRGCIDVSSTVGAGTTFDIYLPTTQEPFDEHSDVTPSRVPRGSGETVLVVEDEESVRQLAERILAANGYLVHVARSGREALDLCGDLEGPVDVLLTDVIMPHMSGQEVASWLRQLKPNFATIFMSGYTDQALEAGTLREAGVSFLQKPFTADRLLQEVHVALRQNRLTRPNSS
jgi:PAS domain S-box-containing protein